MRKWFIPMVAIAAASAAPAFADEAAPDHTGFSVSFGATDLQGTALYTGGKPNAEFDGLSGELGLAYDYQFDSDNDGNGPVIGVFYRTSTNEIEAPANRDGNYLVQYFTLNGYTLFGGRVGYAHGRSMIYAGGGVAQAEATAGQSCPLDWNSVVAGFCRAGGNAVLADGREGLKQGDYEADADFWMIGFEFNINDNWYVDARYTSDISFGEEIVPLNATSIGGADPHPATNPNLEFNGALTLTAAYRF
jgi:opacity protein-like surface antigen